MYDTRHEALKELRSRAMEELPCCCQTLANTAPVVAYIELLERSYRQLTGHSLEEEDATDMADET